MSPNRGKYNPFLNGSTEHPSMFETEIVHAQSDHNSPGHILVVGAGVSGLTTAFCLRRVGFTVTIVAEKFAPNITSVVAGALWEWPPAVCGQPQDQISLARSKKWCKTSYDIFSELATNVETGVFMRTVTSYLRCPLEKDPLHFQKVTELKDKVRDLVHDSSLILRNGVSPQSEVCDAYSLLAPMVDTDAYMAWLLGEVRRIGCRVVQLRLTGRLHEQEESLKREFEVDAIVNCAGLGSAELANEAMFPLRGALARVLNNGKRFPRITQAHCVAHQGNANESGFIFIVPRGNDMLVLGGIAERDQWGLDIGLHNYDPIRKMFQRCINFLPVLKNAEVDPTEPVRVGLRPFRRQNVRLERESGTHIVHNYGHGGAGVTFSWGCALEAVEIVRSMVHD
jgi:D-amino-acid oxidase